MAPMRRLLASAIALAALSPAAVAAPPRAARGAVPVLVIDGRGWGHGVGMAQDGAYWMGRDGATTAQILDHFYPGTKPGRGGGEVRVGVLAAPGGQAVVAFPGGGEVRDARGGPQSPGFPLRVPAGAQVRLRFDGRRYEAEALGAGARPAAGRAPSPDGAHALAAPSPSRTTVPGAQVDDPLPTTTSTTAPGLPLPPPTTPTTAVPPPTTTTLPAAPRPGPTAPPPAPAPTRATSDRTLWAVPAGGGMVDVPERGNRYRGQIEAVAGGGQLRLVNQVDVEEYLRGMGEVRDPGWPPASLRAQAVAARTYALRAMEGRGELCDSQQCQVYLGAAAEYGAMDRAVAATRGQVLTFGRRLASTVYSANAGGFSATPEEGFGTANEGYPYLRPAPYVTRDPMPWTIRVALADVRARLGYRGRLDVVRPARSGPSQRVVQVALEGTAGRRDVPGVVFRKALGLRSTLFQVRRELAAAPPPPPPGEGPVQGLPEELGPPGVAPVGLPPVLGPEVPPLGLAGRHAAASVTVGTSPAVRVAALGGFLGLSTLAAIAAFLVARGPDAGGAPEGAPSTSVLGSPSRRRRRRDGEQVS